MLCGLAGWLGSLAASEMLFVISACSADNRRGRASPASWLRLLDLKRDTQTTVALTSRVAAQKERRVRTRCGGGAFAGSAWCGDSEHDARTDEWTLIRLYEPSRTVRESRVLTVGPRATVSMSYPGAGYHSHKQQHHQQQQQQYKCALPLARPWTAERKDADTRVFFLASAMVRPRTSTEEAMRRKASTTAGATVRLPVPRPASMLHRTDLPLSTTTRVRRTSRERPRPTLTKGCRTPIRTTIS